MNHESLGSASEHFRRALGQDLFPRGIPRLWCPTLTHFSARGQLDEARIRCHLQVLAPCVKGILVPGSTGEGWEMNDGDILHLLSVVLEAAKAADIRVLIGVLKTDVPAMLQCIDATLAFLRKRAGVSSAPDALRHANVVGFTVCPPKGRDLSQAAIAEAMTGVLRTSLPIALYQLPQVTGNEMGPDMIQELARAYPNFHLFKDTSGHDRVASACLDLDGVFLVRGAEGDYARWPKSAGGPYDGFLLSTANVFAREYDAMLRLLDQGQSAEAQALAGRLDRVIKGCFESVAGHPAGNPFTNANKALDHVMAHGPAALRMEPPLLYSGARLRVAQIERARELLRENGLLPERGYLEG